MTKVINYSVRPKFKASCDITRNDIVNMCDEFGPHVTPSRYSQGGITFARDEIGSNSIRFMSMDFPYIDDHVKEKWVGDNTIVFPRNKYLGTVFKTWLYKGDDYKYDDKYKPFKYEDMEYIYAIFRNYGLKVTKKASRRDFTLMEENM